VFKKVLFLTFVITVLSFFPKGETSAQCIGGGTSNINCLSETGTSGSVTLSFDPTVNLLPAVTNTDPSAGPCFTCPNTVAGANGTTAGALTNSMFGEIRLNSNADLGNQSYSHFLQGMTVPIPAAPNCGTSFCNDSGAFSFSLPLPTQDFLSAGTPVTSPVPDPGTPVGQAGMRVEMSQTFTYNADDTSFFQQSVKQTTFTGGAAGNEVQSVDFSAIGDNNVVFPPGLLNGSGGDLSWVQTIEEGGFFLGPLSGSFTYNNFGFEFDGASAPTGESQSNGTDNIIGFP